MLMLPAPKPVLLLPERIPPGLDYIYHMDALAFLRALPDNYVDTVVTSPAYFGLRDYQMLGQIGLEDTPQEYLDRLVCVFLEVRRVLKQTGSLWVNIGDSYANDSKWGGSSGSGKTGYMGDAVNGARTRRFTGLPPKSLMMIPARFAIAMQDAGWILRSEIIWAKKNGLPESVKDRPTRSHEKVYLFTKHPFYWYDYVASREPAAYDGRKDTTMKGSEKYQVAVVPGQSEHSFHSGVHERWQMDDDGQHVRNMRDVWHLPTEPYPGNHFAVMPTELVRKCLVAGCPPVVCSQCGKPHYRDSRSVSASADNARDWQGAPEYQPNRGGHRQEPKKTGSMGTPLVFDDGLRPACSCAAGSRPGIALDPFMGSGTVAVVARQLNRHYIGTDLNRDYVLEARARLIESDPFQARTAVDGMRQLSLFS